MTDRLRPDHGGIAENDENIVGAARDRALGGEHRVGGAVALRLHEDVRARHDPMRFGRDRIATGGDHDGRHGTASLTDGVEHMCQQRPAGDSVQHLRARRAHAGALAGGEHDGKAGAFRRQFLNPLNRLRSPGAVISERAAPEKAECGDRVLCQESDQIWPLLMSSMH